MFVSLQKQCREGYSLHLFDDGTLARLASACNTPIININICLLYTSDAADE